MQALQDDDTRYEPSRPLRDLITERMVEQNDCLLKQNKKILKRLTDANLARNASTKAPGDQQVDAATVKGIVEAAKLGQTGICPGYLPPGTTPSMMGGLSGGLRLMPNDSLIQRGTSSARSLYGTADTGTGTGTSKDPMERYKQLQAEIDGFMALHRPWPPTMGRGRGDFNLSDMQKAKLKEILGTPKKAGNADDSDDDDDAGPSQRAQNPHGNMQQNTRGGGPMQGVPMMQSQMPPQMQPPPGMFPQGGGQPQQGFMPHAGMHQRPSPQGWGGAGQ